MRPGRSIVAAGILLAFWPPCASADWLVMPFVSLTFNGATTLVDLDNAAGDTRVAYGGAVSYLGTGVLGVEVDFGYSPGFFEGKRASSLITSSHVLTLMGNVVLTTPISWTNLSLRPYLSGGFGAMRATTDDVLNLFKVQSTLLGLNAGGGALGFFTERTGVRWDIRYFKSDRGAADTNAVGFGRPQLSFWRASIALVLRY